MREELKCMSCQEFQDQLPELLGSGLNIAYHPHYRECELCQALLAELETIAQAARQLLPIVEPPEKVWKQIELAILAEDESSNSG